MIIDVHDLRKVFRITRKQPGLLGSIRALFRPNMEDKVAVDGVSFSVATGEVVGYIGVNGAGKSTTIKMLTGILAPTGGSVRVLGRDPHRQRVANAREIGAVFGQRTQLWWDLPFIESIDLIGKIYDVPRDRFQARMQTFGEILGLDELYKMPVRTMSLGQKMRAELAAAFIHEPKIVYLDEPTIGLDLLVKERIRAFIKHINAVDGVTVLLTTHDLGDIEQLCQRVLIIDAGRLVYDGPLSTIRDRFGQYREITFELSADSDGFQPPVGTEVIASEPRRVALRFDRTRTSASRVTAAVLDQVEVADFSLTEPGLADVVRRIYQGALK
jgi:ABC-2 type transport system ATP-binding protein